MNEVYSDFLKRKIPEESLKKMAVGRVFCRKKAKELRLVDTLGTFDFTFEIVKQLTGVKKLVVVSFREFFDFSLSEIISLFTSFLFNYRLFLL
ncbi:MAG: S49 family peptidase [candidate division WOR-3 bacterium]|nr:S49 family peptidase [candidate division WOR-3 bacterium]MDW8114645.1 S49 family peptidase [candidate division WOR-3 bacterium]